MEDAHKQELLKIQQEYITNLENLTEDTKKFKHDYVNIISPLYGFIENKDFDGLNNYFTSNIVPISDKMKAADSTIDQLKNIEITEIKGLLTIKLTHIQERGIKVRLSVPSVIDSINFDMMSLSRIIGILLDNAADACLETDKPYVNIFMQKESKSVTMLIANPFKSEPPPITEIFKKGFTTKGDGHGLGLHMVRELIDKQKGAYIQTYVKDGEFIQELIFEDSERS